MLRASGDEDRRIQSNAGDDCTEGGPGVSLVVDIGIGQHRVAAPANSAGGTGFGLGKHNRYPVRIRGRYAGIDGKPCTGKSPANAVRIDYVAERGVSDAIVTAISGRIAK